jgi:hypothetical protein
MQSRLKNAGRLNDGCWLWILALVMALALQGGIGRQNRAIAAGPKSVTTGVRLDFVDDAGGATSALAGDGRYLFVARGSTFLVVDSSSPNHPVVIGRSRLVGGGIRSIAVHGQLAYLAVYEVGLVVLDLADVARPREVGRFELHGASHLLVRNGFAHIATAQRGLVIVDIRNPAAPKLAGEAATGINGEYVAEMGRYLLLGHRNGIIVVNAENPHTPAQVATLSGFWVNQIAVYGDMLFATGPAHKVTVIDAAEPLALRPVGELAQAAQSLAIESGRLITVAEEGIRLYDLADPATPRELHFYRYGAHTTTQHEDSLRRVHIVEGYAFAIDAAGNVQVFEISISALPPIVIHVGALEVDAQVATLLARQGDFVYLAGEQRLSVLSVGLEGEAPGFIATTEVATPAEQLAVGGRYLLLAGVRNGPQVEIVDVSNRSNVSSVGIYQPASKVMAMDADGERMVLIEASGHVSVIDLSEPSMAQELGRYESLVDPRAVVVDGPFAYVINGRGVLSVLDIQQPDAIRLVTEYAVAADGRLLAKDGRFLYIAGSDRLSIVDVSSPQAPQGTATTLVGIGDVRYLDSNLGMAALADGFGRVVLVRVSGSGEIEAVCRQERQIFTTGVALAGDSVYLANGIAGVSRLRIRDTIEATFDSNALAEFSLAHGLEAALAPGVLYAADLNTIRLVYSEPYVEASAATPARFALSPAFAVEAEDPVSGQAPTQPAFITLTIDFKATDVTVPAGADLMTAAFYALVGDRWQRLGNSAYDSVHKTLTAIARSSGPWAVFAEQATEVSLFLPVVSMRRPLLQIDAMEVTQSIQSLDLGVPLVAGKPALLRAYVGVSGGAVVDDVMLRLSAWRDGTLLGQVQAGPWAIFAQPERKEYSKSINLLLPSEWLSGYVQLTARASYGSAQDSRAVAVERSLAVNFTPAPPLAVMVVPVQYLHLPTGALYPASSEERFSDWVARLFPVDQVRIHWHAPVRYAGDLTNPASWTALIRQIADLKRSERAPEEIIYYGLLPTTDLSMAIAGIGYMGIRVSVGLNQGAVAGHEFGHNLGRLHAPCGNPSNPDPAYPYANASIGEFGFDTATFQIWTPDLGADLMSYCAPVWISDYTYRRMLADQQRFAAVVAAENGVEAERPVIFVRVELESDGEARFLPSYQWIGTPDAATGEGDAHIVMLDVGGLPLAEHAVRIYTAADGAAARAIRAVLPLPGADVGALQLWQKGRLLTETLLTPAQASATAPSVQMDEAHLRVQWQDTHQPALVRYRSTASARWTTLGIDRIGGALTADLAWLPGGEGVVEVLLADQSTTGLLSAATASVQIAAKPPRVWITGPQGSAPEQPLVLYGHAYDAEDGVLDSLTWWVNGAQAGEGPALQLAPRPAPGLLVTLQAVDSDGLHAEAQYVVE